MNTFVAADDRAVDHDARGMDEHEPRAELGAAADDAVAADASSAGSRAARRARAASACAHCITR